MIVIKVLGALYSIPFYSLIGDKGGFLYSCAYNVYVFFLDISTSGIPVALSILIGEYNALEMYGSKEKAYKLGRNIVAVIALAAFAFMQIAATPLANFFLTDMTTGATVAEVAIAIRVVSTCLLVVPFLSVLRGYMLGHKFIAVSSNTQLIEQIIRIAVVLIGAYVTLRVFHMDLIVAVSTALSGAAIGAFGALLYLIHKKTKNANLFPTTTRNEVIDTNSVIVHKLVGYSVVVILISIASNVYFIVDMKLLLHGLHRIGYADTDAQTIASITSTWIPKITNIVTALALAMTSSIAPHIADDYAVRNYKGIQHKINQAFRVIILLALPMSVGLIGFADSIYCMFYGHNDFGTYILMVTSVVNIALTGANLLGMSLQSMNRGKIVCFATITGIVANASLDLPLIYLFNRIGFRPYLGAVWSSVIGQSLTCIILTAYLYKKTPVRYTEAMVTLRRAIPPLAVMSASVWLFRKVWPVVEQRGLLQVFQLLVAAVVCAGIFYLTAFATRAMDKDVVRELIRERLKRD